MEMHAHVFRFGSEWWSTWSSSTLEHHAAYAAVTLVDPSRTAPRAHVRAPALDRTTYRFYTLKY
jgi:hypothetical protein